MIKALQNLSLLVGFLICIPQVQAQLNASSNNSSIEGEITLKDIWASGKFNPKGIKGFTAMKDGKSFVALEENALNIYDLKSGKKSKTLLSEADLSINDKTLKIASFKFSDDETKILITTDVKSIYRHSTSSSVYVYDLKLKKLYSVFEGGNCMYPTFSPDGSKVVGVTDNNILVMDYVTQFITLIGGDGLANEVLNGRVDWVYEEEFSMSRGYEWSPDGKHIAYYKFVEKLVPEFTLELYQGKSYPVRENYKYPKAGEANSVVSVYLFDFATSNSRLIETTEEDDSYLPRIQWANKDFLYIQKLNRHQNHLEVMKVNVTNSQSVVIWEEKNKYYIDINNEFYFANEGNTFLFLTEMNGYNQIMRMDTRTMEATLVTEPMYDVDKIVFYDAAKEIVYYTSAEVSPTERHLYKIDIKKKNKEKLSNQVGWNSVNFITGGMFYVNIHSTFTTPSVYSLHDNNGKLIRVLEDNKELKARIDSLSLGKSEFGQLTTEEGISLNYWQILPPNFNENKKYPVLFFVYGGPGSQTVKNSWGGPNFFWHQLLAQQGYIVMSVDNRGTGFRGEEFKKSTYLNLGKLEIQDQIASAKWMAQKPYVNKDRIGIWGWSYGGFMSSLGITLGADVFKTAIAVAPVTHWKYYDNIYTERYMRTPQENKEGYDFNAPLSHVDKIKGNYLLIHGMADDNVHMQHATEMIRAMIDKNIAFQSEFYPNKNHGIYGGMTRLHLYSRMTSFILEKL